MLCKYILKVKYLFSHELILILPKQSLEYNFFLLNLFCISSVSPFTSRTLALDHRGS